MCSQSDDSGLEEEPTENEHADPDPAAKQDQFRVVVSKLYKEQNSSNGSSSDNSKPLEYYVNR